MASAEDEPAAALLDPWLLCKTGKKNITSYLKDARQTLIEIKKKVKLTNIFSFFASCLYG